MLEKRKNKKMKNFKQLMKKHGFKDLKIVKNEYILYKFVLKLKHNSYNSFYVSCCLYNIQQQPRNLLIYTQERGTSNDGLKEIIFENNYNFTDSENRILDSIIEHTKYYYTNLYYCSKQYDKLVKKGELKSNER